MIQITLYDIDEAQAALRGIASHRFVNPGPQISRDAPTTNSDEPLPPPPAAPSQIAVPVVTKRTRRSKAEMAAAAQVDPPNEVPPDPIVQEPVAPSSFLDEDEPARLTTKADARAALVALQLKRQGQYEAKGVATNEAVTKAQADTVAVLKAASGVERFGSIADDDHAKLGRVVDAANVEAAK